MSQFTMLLKRPSAQGGDSSVLQHLPKLCILELTSDNLVYLWPASYTVSAPESLDPEDPVDQELLLTGEFLTYGGFFYSVPDFLCRNGLSEMLFYRFDLGDLRDIAEARDALEYLKSQL